MKTIVLEKDSIKSPSVTSEGRGSHCSCAVSVDGKAFTFYVVGSGRPNDHSTERFYVLFPFSYVKRFDFPHKSFFCNLTDVTEQDGKIALALVAGDKASIPSTLYASTSYWNDNFNFEYRLHCKPHGNTNITHTCVFSNIDLTAYVVHHVVSYLSLSEFAAEVQKALSKVEDQLRQFREANNKFEITKVTMNV